MFSSLYSTFLPFYTCLAFCPFTAILFPFPFAAVFSFPHQIPFNFSSCVPSQELATNDKCSKSCLLIISGLQVSDFVHVHEITFLSGKSDFLWEDSIRKCLTLKSNILNHRVMQVGKDYWKSSSPTSSKQNDWCNQTRLLVFQDNLVLKTSRDWDSKPVWADCSNAWLCSEWKVVLHTYSIQQW